MIALEAVTVANAMLFRDVRLRALLDAPSAFSATYTEESRLADADWLNRAAERSGRRSTSYLAMDGKNPCGIVAGFIDKDDRLRAHLVSMWVAPTHRRLGIGRKLVDAIVDWARAQDARTLKLTVTSNNHPAITFYEHIGFTMTGQFAPYRNDPALSDLEMIRSLS